METENRFFPIPDHVRLKRNIDAQVPNWLESHQGSNVQVLAIGFGAGKELITLRILFPESNIFAVDKDQLAFDTGKLLNKRYNLNISIVKADARDENAVFASNNLKPDLIVMRSFGIVNDEAVNRMTEILEIAHKRLMTGGLIYITTDLAVEVENMENLLNKLRFNYIHHTDEWPNPEGIFKETDVFLIVK